MTWCKWRLSLSASSLECSQYIFIRILVITLLQIYISVSIFGILFHLIIMFCRNLSKIFLFAQHREIYFIRERVYGRFTVRKSRKNESPCPRDSSTKHKLSVAVWQTAWSRGNETIPEKRDRYSPVGRVAKKNLPLYLSALYEIYIPSTHTHISADARDTLASFPLISVHNTFARVVDSTGRRWMNRPCT